MPKQPRRPEPSRRTPPLLPAALALLAVLALVPAAAAPASAQGGGSTPAVVATAPAAGAPLQPGDAIRLSFWREPALSGEYLVDETGAVVLPYLGARSVDGVDATTLRRRIVTEYEGVLANQGVQVGLLRRIRILGAVRTPGLYRVDATMSLADALAMAGGLAPNGRMNGVRIVRGGQVIPVDLRAETPVEAVLRSGDQITVAESGWFARNSGALLGALISAVGFVVGQAIF